MASELHGVLPPNLSLNPDVEPASRRNGVARALVADVERWALAERCSELASDSPLENVTAHAAHRALGFEETERVVYFRRPVHGA